MTIVFFHNFLEIFFVRSCAIPTLYYTISATEQMLALLQEPFVSFTGSDILRLQCGYLEYWAGYASRSLIYV